MHRPTPIAATGNVVVKFEAFNRGGSHKCRPARFMVERAIARGELRPGGPRRILEKTGGNLGVGLAYEAGRRGIGVDLVIGLSFAKAKRDLCEAFGARLVGVDMLERGLQPKEVVAELLAREPDRYLFTDQFNNPANLEAHLRETGPELAAQLDGAGLLRGRPLVLVKGAGTGASLTGIARALAAAGADLETVMVVPEGCDVERGVFVSHTLEGIAVGVRPPFLDMGLVARSVAVSGAEARDGQRALARDLGFLPGPTSGANYAVARRLARARPDATVVTVAYDAGDPSALARASAPSPEVPRASAPSPAVPRATPPRVAAPRREEELAR